MKILRTFLTFCFLLSLSVAPQNSFAEGKRAPSKIDSRSMELNEKGVTLVKAKNFVAAEDLFEKAVDLDPQNLSAVFNLGGVYIGVKKYDEAISLLSPYTAKGTADAGIYVRLGDAYFANKQISNALENYEKAKSIAPKYAGLASKMGTLYALSNRLLEAETALKEAVSINQKDGQSLSNLSSVLLANGKAEESVRTAKRALQVSPSSDLYVTLGNGYERLNDKKNALIAFQRASDLGSNAPGLQDKIDQLKK